MAHALTNGLVVLFEGIDGVGKSTQVELAQKALAADWPVHTTRNLGGTPIGEVLRDALLTPIPRPAKTDLYVSVAIQEALLEAVAQLRAENKVVLIDRSPLSLAAYQIYGSGIDKETGMRYVESGMSQLQPELTIIYRGDITTALDRARQSSGKADYFESKPTEYFERVADGYDAMGERYHAVFIDAGQSIETIHAETMRHIQAAIAAKSAQA